MTSKSLLEQLAELANPEPTSHDPEDDIYEETRARVADWQEEDAAQSDDGSAPSRLRQRAAALLPDLDPRYAGRTVSRKSLQQDSGDEGSPNGSRLSDEESDAAADPEDQDEDGEDEDDDQLGAFKAKLTGVEAGTNGLSTDDGEAETDSEEVAVSGEDSAEREDTDAVQEDGGEEGEEEKGDSAAAESEGEEDWEDISSALDSGDGEEEEDGVNLTSQPAGSDALKGAAVKAQLSVWDQLLECRIKVQPALQLSGQLPAPGASWTDFWAAAGADTAARLADAGAAADRLLQQMLQLQDLLTEQFPETRELLSGAATKSDSDPDSDPDSSERPAPRPRKRRRSDLTAADPDKRFAAYRPYRDQTVQRWNDKTRMTAGRRVAKSFAAFEQSTLKQIEQILSDRDRLLRRTQLRRSNAARLGQPADTEDTAAADAKQREYDVELFDDSDFYHQLLRELIERKTVDVTDPLALGRQWIQIQKLRSKLKKRVDTRASKGRKVRYEVHPKLVNFMASERAGSMTDSARDELFGSLFGSRCRPAGGDRAATWSSLNGDRGVIWADMNGGPAV